MYIWIKAPSTVLCSAAIHGGKVLSVGYGEKVESFTLEQRSLRLIDTKENIFCVAQKGEGIDKTCIVLQ